jgi:hypothetical protein
MPTKEKEKDLDVEENRANYGIVRRARAFGGRDSISGCKFSLRAHLYGPRLDAELHG